MKTVLRFSFLLAVLFGLAAASSIHAAGLEGILITASNERGATDGRLAPYEPTLRRILRFESYHFIGSDDATLEGTGQSRLSLGGGHQLEITPEHSDGRALQVKVRWTAGGRTLMNTGLTLRTGVPAVLGGPSTGKGSEVYAVILVGR